MTTHYTSDTDALNDTLDMDVEAIQDIYPLSPMQQGMLFHSLYAPESGVYIIQFHCVLQGELHIPSFKRAWQHVINRHAIFRTGFMWEGLREPMQVVYQHVLLPWEECDWRGYSAAEQQERLEEYLKQDRTHDFDFAQAPLMRLFLVQGAEDCYYFTWSYHHIVLDGWSWPLVFKDLFAYYDAFHAQRTLYLAPAPLYRDYIAWLQNQDQHEAEVFWRQALHEYTMPSQLPMKQKPGQKWASQADVYDEQHILLAEDKTEALQKLVICQQLTLNTIVQGAWAILMSRYSGEHDIVFGATTSGRPASLPGVEALVGPCINTLPIRIQVEPDAFVLMWLKALQKQQVHARQYEYSSLLEIQGWSEVPRKLSLFDSLLAFENYPVEPSSQNGSGGVALTHMRSIEQTNFPLTITVIPGKELLIHMKYDRSCFEYDTIQQLLRNMQTLLDSIVCEPEQQLYRLPLLDSIEREQMFATWNATHVPVPQDQCLHQLFEAQVQRTPHAVALLYEKQQMIYQELNGRANQLARYLQTLGVKEETLVSICMERSLDMVVGLLAILKAGGAYIPLDPTYPKERIAFMLSNAHTPVLLTQQRVVAKLPQHDAPIICIDTDWHIISKHSVENVSTEVKQENLAYIIYTSGSTGKPKGVMISHRAICNHMFWMQSRFPLTEADSVLQKTPFSFDASVWEFYAPLLVGARLVIAKPGGHQDSEYLIKTIEEHEVTTLQLVPSLLQQLLESNEIERCRNLKRVFCGGEELPSSLAQLFFIHLDADLCNLYGPTEATIDTTFWMCKVEERDHQKVPIGHPIDNVQVYVLDDYLQPVPIGVSGELYVGGAGLAKGYLNQPTLTAERFIFHPLHDDMRLYKTGDLARYRADGALEFLGRRDFQVKVRGFRIELGEIENVLCQHPAVQKAVVVVREDIANDKRLVAYVVLRVEHVVQRKEIQHYLSQQLPMYMVPSTVMLLEGLPITPNGKVDRHALPLPDSTKGTFSDNFVAPTLTTHYQLVQIWEELLDVRPIGIKDNFFDLGGHSLLAARMANKIEQVCGKKIPLATLFADATIAHLTDVLLGEEAVRSRTPVITVQAGEEKQPFFFLHGDWTGGAFYCLNVARELGGEQPFYVLEPYRFDSIQAPPTFEEMAAAHLKALREVQPEGPYLLGGFCNGGLVAYEIARQLREQGQRVDLLVLIDPASNGSHRFRREHRIISRLAALLRVGREQQLTWFLWYRYLRLTFHHFRKQKFSRQQKQLEQRLPDVTLDDSLPQPVSLFPSTTILRHDWTGVFEWIASGYEPDLYPGKLTFIWAHDEIFRRVGWRKVTAVKEVTEYSIPGDHTTSRTEHLHAFAERLRMCLEEAQKVTVSK